MLADKQQITEKVILWNELFFCCMLLILSKKHVRLQDERFSWMSAPVFVFLADYLAP